jgi:NAD+ kinase
MGVSLKRFTLLPHKDKPESIELARELVHWLKTHGCEVYLTHFAAELTGLESLAVTKEVICQSVDAVVALGGDGTILNAVNEFAPYGIPILGINLGHLGFLTELEVNEVYVTFIRLLDGNYWFDERMLLAGEVVRQKCVVEEFLGFNDVVIARGAFARIVQLETYVEKDYVTTYPADGLIISSPTGSTAYSLSAGGPMCEPSLELLVLTPICAHTFYSRPMVISSEHTVRVIVRSEREEVVLTIDGQRRFSLEQDDEICVRKADKRVKLIRVHDRSFYEVLRKRLSRGVV